LKEEEEEEEEEEEALVEHRTQNEVNCLTVCWAN
jgi:hypothetical protein